MAKPDVENAVFLAKLAEQAERYEGKFLIRIYPRTYRIANASM
jgi:predicted HicB family RNase H-like nuclease